MEKTLGNLQTIMKQIQKTKKMSKAELVVLESFIESCESDIKHVKDFVSSHKGGKENEKV